jgi:hypothetical protein
MAREFFALPLDTKMEVSTRDLPIDKVRIISPTWN